MDPTSRDPRQGGWAISPSSYTPDNEYGNVHEKWVDGVFSGPEDCSNVAPYAMDDASSFNSIGKNAPRPVETDGMGSSHTFPMGFSD